MEDYKYLWGAIFAFIGIFFLFWGRYYIKHTIFIATTLIVATIMILIAYIIFLSDAPDWVSWICITFSLIAGFAMGFLLMNFFRLGVATTSLWAGISLGTLVNITFLYTFGSKYLMLVNNILWVVIFLFFGYFFFNKTFIFSTAILGSYFFARGVALVFGGFPNEFVLITLISTSEIDRIDPIFYAYLGLIVFLTIGSVIYQSRVWKKMSYED